MTETYKPHIKEADQSLGEVNFAEISKMSPDIINLIDSASENAQSKKLLFKYAKYYSQVLSGQNSYEIRNTLDNIYDKIEETLPDCDHLLSQLEILADAALKASHQEPKNVHELNFGIVIEEPKQPEVEEVA